MAGQQEAHKAAYISMEVSDLRKVSQPGKGGDQIQQEKVGRGSNPLCEVAREENGKTCLEEERKEF